QRGARHRRAANLRRLDRTVAAGRIAGGDLGERRKITLLPAHSRASGNPVFDRRVRKFIPGSPLSAFALRASADFKRAEARNARVGGSRGRADYFAALTSQSGLMRPETPSNAPACNSATSRRAGSTGPGIFTWPLGMSLKPDLA